MATCAGAGSLDVAAPQGERIARLEQAVDDLRSDVESVREAVAADHHRLRNTEAAVNMMLEAHKKARDAEDRQYRRVELRLQVLTAVVAFAALAEPFIYKLAAG